MPDILDRCVKKCQAKPKNQQPESCWAVCIDSLREAGKIKKGKNNTWVLAKEAEERLKAIKKKYGIK